MDTDRETQRTETGEGFVIPDGGPYSLAIIDTVDAIVRSHYIDGVEAMLDGERTNEGRDSAIKRVEEIADDLQEIFFGRRQGFEVTDWNSVEELGVTLTKVLDGLDATDAPNAVKALYLTGLMDIVGAAKQHAKGEINEHSAKATTDWWVDRTTRCLMGLPPEAD